jgi:hypothetical protein
MDNNILDLGSNVNVILKKTWEMMGKLEVDLVTHSVEVIKSA